MSRRRRCAATLAFALLASACAKREPRGDDAPPVDVAVTAFLSEARALHHRADILESNRDPRGAEAALERLLTAARPHPETRVAEVEEVLADTYARVGELRLAQGSPDAARAAVARGLAHAPATSYFRGRLLEVDALVEEHVARRLEDAGARDEAQRAKQRALERFEEVVRVQNEVVERSLEGGPQ